MISLFKHSLLCVGACTVYIIIKTPLYECVCVFVWIFKFVFESWYSHLQDTILIWSSIDKCPIVIYTTTYRSIITCSLISWRSSLWPTSCMLPDVHFGKQMPNFACLAGEGGLFPFWDDLLFMADRDFVYIYMYTYVCTSARMKTRMLSLG